MTFKVPKDPYRPFANRLQKEPDLPKNREESTTPNEDKANNVANLVLPKTPSVNKPRLNRTPSEHQLRFDNNST
jgi:hypothetical protein